MSDGIQQQSRPWPPTTFETLAVRADGATLFAEIASHSTNLPGPSMARDLASLHELAEADDGVSVLVIKSTNTDFLVRTWTSDGSRVAARSLRSW